MGRNFCESHSINIEALEKAVLCSIQEEARTILKKEDIDELKKFQAQDKASVYYEMQLENIQKRIDKIETFKKKTYDSYMDDLLSKEDYVKYISGYEKELEELKAQKETIGDKADLQEEREHRYHEWADALKDYISIKKLTRDVVLELIERIEVGKDGAITIYYKFSNPYMD